MNQSLTIHCLSEALTPITHMARSEGNEALVAREPVMTPQGVRWIPRLSGNALRHRCVRAPGARYLVDALELKGKLTLLQLNFIFHGGNLTEGGGREDTKRIAEMQRLFPLFRLLGGCLPDQILAGSVLSWPGILLCAENQARMGDFLPADWPAYDGYLRPAEHFVSGYQYTRGDASKSERDLLPPDAEADNSNLMIFAGQAVMPGALFLHGFVFQTVAEVEIGALLLSLHLWQQVGGTIGGQAARGHGRLKTAILQSLTPDEATSAVLAYQEHVQRNKEECCQWLTSAFKLDEGSKAKRSRGKKAAPVSEVSPPEGEGNE